MVVITGSFFAAVGDRRKVMLFSGSVKLFTHIPQTDVIIYYVFTIYFHDFCFFTLPSGFVDL